MGRWLAVVGLAAGVAGCGGADPAEYRAAANAACSRSQESFARLPSPADPEQLVTYLRGSLDLQRRLASELAAVEPPEELAADHGRLVAAARGQAQLLDRMLKTLTKEGGRAFGRRYERDRPRLDELIAQGEAAADELRLAECRAG